MRDLKYTGKIATRNFFFHLVDNGIFSKANLNFAATGNARKFALTLWDFFSYFVLRIFPYLYMMKHKYIWKDIHFLGTEFNYLVLIHC